jgi:hypothetical protein
LLVNQSFDDTPDTPCKSISTSFESPSRPYLPCNLPSPDRLPQHRLKAPVTSATLTSPEDQPLHTSGIQWAVAVSADPLQVMSPVASALMNGREREILRGMPSTFHAVTRVATVLLHALRQQTA